MIYFSAHWCPPCRGFTPTLATFYNAYKKTNPNFELVFASSDKDEKQFSEYYGTMPWLALPFSDRERKNKLSKQFNVQGIPTLVVVDSDGSLITADGRTGVDEDPSGADFPWKPKTLTELMGEKLTSKSGEIATSSIDEKFLMIYFSAHWCPPCRMFTPKLIELYNKMKESRTDFDCLFVSSDRDEAAFNEYYGEMPWLSLDYNSTKSARDQISSKFEVEGIPSLVVLGPKKANGERDIINKNARGAAVLDNIAKFPWYPEKYADLGTSTECNGSSLNDDKSVIILAEAADDEEQEQIKQEVIKAAEKLAEKDGEKTLFYYAMSNEGVVPRIRELCKLGKIGGDVQMIILDIPDNGKYYVSKETNITAATIEEFLKNPGEKKQLS